MDVFNIKLSVKETEQTIFNKPMKMLKLLNSTITRICLLEIGFLTSGDNQL